MSKQTSLPTFISPSGRPPTGSTTGCEGMNPFGLDGIDEEDDLIEFSLHEVCRRRSSISSNKRSSDNIPDVHNNENICIGDKYDGNGDNESTEYDSSTDCDDDDDSSDSESEEHSTVPSKSISRRDPNNEVLKIAYTETVKLRFWRVVVVAMIILLGATVVTKTIVDQNESEKSYHTESFMNDARTIEDDCTKQFETIQESIKELSRTVTASAIATNQVFPFVIVPDFEIYNNAIRRHSPSIEMTAFVPIVANTSTELALWQKYSSESYNLWYEESVREFLLTGTTEDDYMNGSMHVLGSNNTNSDQKPLIRTGIWTYTNASIEGINEKELGINSNVKVHGPIWQVSPPPKNAAASINYDAFTIPFVAELLKKPQKGVMRRYVGTLSKFIIQADIESPPYDDGNGDVNTTALAVTNPLLLLAQGHDDEPIIESARFPLRSSPRSIHLQPIYYTINAVSSTTTNTSTNVNTTSSNMDDQEDIDLQAWGGVLISVVNWEAILAQVASNHGMQAGIIGVLQNSCEQSYTYKFLEGKVEFIGSGNIHDPSYEDMVYKINFRDSNDDENPNLAPSMGQCLYSLSLYSSEEYKLTTLTTPPLGSTPTNQNAWTIGISIIFIVILLSFCKFDTYVKLRNAKVLSAATRANLILATLFPARVRDRMLEDVEAAEKNDHLLQEQLYFAPKTHLKTIIESGKLKDRRNVDDEEMGQDEVNKLMYKSKPIADLFPETTILFADIVGFTAWSSVREPTQVFILLETLYNTFDSIAQKRRVFKVETVGDCYVAVTGLPDPRRDHAVVMARFAKDCLLKMERLVKNLERCLGPDTGDLCMRMGIHSGPVTAGVLRGDRSRFQLFGDTMNTAARMEQTSLPKRIQLTTETANLLILAGKSRWVTRRDSTVSPKGKGEMNTFWLVVKGTSISRSNCSGTNSGQNTSSRGRDTSQSNSSNDRTEGSSFDSKINRLIDWNAQILRNLLKQIVVRREVCPEVCHRSPNENEFMQGSRKPIEEIQEIIDLPVFDERTLKGQRDPEQIDLPKEVNEQLLNYVRTIAATYSNNPFHNFEHASHVLMSVNKLLSRIIAPDISSTTNDHGVNAATLHDHTYGITSDPLTQFACVFSALIHDCDHPGVPNAQLVNEKTTASSFYNCQSVAEQHSIDLAWSLLMGEDFKDLRNTIYQNDAELKRFRNLVVNSVMATDIVDKELKTLRNRRWERAFSTIDEGANDKEESLIEQTNRKATIVIEHLIQASDISHTMQHWNVYRKWNERFFCECYQAYKDGRAAGKDPSESWYEGEIGFFDFYIIPLAKKLKNCGVFGVSSDEYLNYAMKNRQEWEARGREVVAEMIALVKSDETISENDWKK